MHVILDAGIALFYYNQFTMLHAREEAIQYTSPRHCCLWSKQETLILSGDRRHASAKSKSLDAGP